MMGSGGPVHIERVRVGDLPAFASRHLAELRPGEVVAITEPRALAHSRNPHADPDDVGLLVARQGDRCVGYLGVMPARVETEAGVRTVHWMSTMFVLPELRGAGIGVRLMEELADLGRDMLGTAFTPAAARAMKSFGFIEFGPVNFYTVDIRRAMPWVAPLAALRRWLRTRGGPDALRTGARRMERGLGAPMRALVYRALIRPFESSASTVRCVELDGVPDDAFTPDPGTIRFIRDADVVRWMLRDAWLRESARTPNDASARYHFKHTVQLFRRAVVEVRDGSDTRQGLLVLSASEVRERIVARVLDHRLAGTAYHAAIACTLRFAHRHGADSVVFPESFGPSLGRSRPLRLLARRSSRMYLYRPVRSDSPLAGALDRMELDYCDGDTAFT